MKRLESKRVCDGCVGEAYLGDAIRRTGTQGACSYCGGRGATQELSEVTALVQVGLAGHFVNTAA